MTKVKHGVKPYTIKTNDHHPNWQHESAYSISSDVYTQAEMKYSNGKCKPITKVHSQSALHRIGYNIDEKNNLTAVHRITRCTNRLGTSIIDCTEASQNHW